MLIIPDGIKFYSILSGILFSIHEQKLTNAIKTIDS